MDVVALDLEPLDLVPVDRGPLDRDPLDRRGMGVVALDLEPLDLEPLDVEPLDLEPLDRGLVAVAQLGMTVTSAPRPKRLEQRVRALIGAQLLLALGFGLVADGRAMAIGRFWIVATLALVFALTGFLSMSLEFHRHRFTFTLAEAVLVVGFFVAGPIGLAIAAALGEGVNMLTQRHATLKVAFNVSNRLVATTAAAIAFAGFGNHDVHDAAAWGAALGAALCFSILDVASTAAVLSIVEETRFHNVFVRSATAGLLATLTSAPVGLVVLDLADHGPFVPLLLAPIAAAVALNAMYAVSQRDEHLRFERLYESSARTASLLALGDALRALAVETRSLGTGIAAVCCAADADGVWQGAYADDDGERVAAPDTVARATALAARVGNREVDTARAPELTSITPGAGCAVVVSSQDRGKVVLIVLREGATNAAAKSRVETLAAFAQNAALIVSNALLHEERAVALARQVDLNRQKSDFVAAVSHELRTPLAVMLGSVHTLERLDGRMTDEQRTQLFDMTVDQGGRLQRLIDELLLVAAAEHSDVQPRHERIEIVELFAQVAADTAASIDAERLAWSTNGAGAVVSDPSKIERILLNLVENAAKYAPGAAIELNAHRSPSGTVRLEVIDHGPGIPECDRERVFEQFVQLDQSSTRRKGGTGLGLHLCRQLAEVVDGQLALEPTPGGGCTFSLTLPGSLAAADATTNSGSPEAASKVCAPTEASFANVRIRPHGFALARQEHVR